MPISLFLLSTSNVNVQCPFVFQVDVCKLSTMYSNQEETDTREVLCLHHAVAIGCKNAVVRIPDICIFVILLYHAHAFKRTEYVDMGSERHRHLLNL